MGCVRCSTVYAGLGSLNQVDLSGPPLFGEKRLERAVEAQDHEPALSGMVWIQLPRLTPSGCFGPKYTVVEPSGLGSAAGDG